MNKIACEVSIFYLYYDWINLVYCSKRVILLQSQRSGQKKSILAYNDTQEKRQLENNKTIFETGVLNPFLWEKNKGKLFCDGKSRGLLWSTAALTNRICPSKAMFSKKSALKSPRKFDRDITELAIWNLWKKDLWAFFVRSHFYVLI